MARGAPVISHMLFADDSYVYGKASSEEASKITQLLYSFERASGQKIILLKSTVFFSKNTSEEVRNQVCAELQIPEGGANSKYLGLPCTLGRNKSAILGYLKDKMSNRIRSWNNKLLSRGGKEVLLKTVVQSLPTYAMNVFLIPTGMCTELERMMARF